MKNLLKKAFKAVLPYGILTIVRILKLTKGARLAEVKRQKNMQRKINIFCKYFLKNKNGEYYFEINGAKLPDIRKYPEEMEFFINCVIQDVFFFHYFLNDNYDKSLAEIMDFWMIEGPYGYKDGSFDVSVKPGDVVIDVGAWIGDFSAYSCSKGATTYAFEPVHSSMIFLQKTADLNKDGGVIHCINKGLSNYKGETSISYNNAGSTSMAIKYKSKKTETISITTLDDFVKENKISKIDFIKADIEGEERNMLKGASEVLKNYAPKLAICTYHFPEDPELLEKIILEANPKYKIVHLRHKLFAQVV
jgi:FkbM family methyltransferase